jgi:ubiquinone/menaquinone biosynthesis C-methylase UbiE
MKEYYGKGAKIYHQTKGKRFLLIPAILRNLKPVTKGKLLDVACGNGDFSILVNKKGYEYHGLDVSPDMIKRAREDFPHGKFQVASATKFASKYKEKFDVILISMLFPAMDKLSGITKVLTESVKVLKKDGHIIIGVTHPSFDHYMQSFLFNRADVKTKFTGYYSSGTKYRTPQKFNGGELVFEDYHWTLSDYVNAIHKAGLSITNIDECKPSIEAKKDKPFYQKRLTFPTYLTITVRHGTT